jgi:hypothetical protein
MDGNNRSFKKGIPFYIAGIAIIVTGFFIYSGPSWYYTLAALIVFIAAGSIFYLGWLMHMGKDTKEFDDGSGGGGRIYLDKPAA